MSQHLGARHAAHSRRCYFAKEAGHPSAHKYQAGETVIANGSRTDRSLILKEGSVVILRDTIEIAKVAEPGAVLGELSTLLDQPHTADVRALETSQFHVAKAAALLGQDSIVLLYVAAALAKRLHVANQAVIKLKRQLQTGQPLENVGSTLEKLEAVLGPVGSSLAYAGYPYDPYA